MNGFRGLFKNISGNPTTDVNNESDQVESSIDTNNEGDNNTSNTVTSSFFNNTSSFFQSVQAKKDNLVNNISLTIGNIGQQHKQPIFKTKENSDDSSASEYGDGGDCPNYEDERVLEKAQSFDSIESMTETEFSQCHDRVIEIFQKTMTNDHVFDNGQDVKVLDEVLELETNECVERQVFENICKVWRICLNKLDEVDDAPPAVILMQLTYTVHTITDPNTKEKEYLYTRLRDLSIWKSLAFWNAAFFVVMHREKAKMAKDNSDEKIKSTKEKLKADKKRHDEVAYNQLNKFVWFMHIMGIEKENCLEFLRRQADSVSLSKEKRCIIESNVRKSFNDVTK